MSFEIALTPSGHLRLVRQESVQSDRVYVEFYIML